MLTNQAKHTVDVESPSEAKGALEAAETLGLELRHVEVRGRWDYTEDIDITRHAECEIEKIGRKWFYLTVTGKTIQCKPGTSTLDSLDDGTLRLKFD